MMQKISREVHQQIVELLKKLPSIQGQYGQEAFLSSANLDKELVDQLPLNLPTSQFVELLVSTCLKYGRLHNGRQALEIVLETAKMYVGQEGRELCDTLIATYREHSSMFQRSQPKHPTRRPGHETEIPERIHQTSQGKQSPNIATQGDVTITFGKG